MTTDTGERPCFVYRYYDVDDHPLYIGCSFNVERRAHAHRQKAWWPMVAPPGSRAIPKQDVGAGRRHSSTRWKQREQWKRIQRRLIRSRLRAERISEIRRRQPAP